MERKVAIVGAGISGLLACKYCLSKGFRPIVFESKSSIGGAWINTFETTKLQTPKPLYQFTDFSWPTSITDDYPTQEQVLDYIQSYATHFDLLKYIKFNSMVESLDYESPADEDEMQAWTLWGGIGEPFSSGNWKLSVHDSQSLSSEVYQVDFVILCVGRFSDVPNIPEFPPPNKGPDEFHGKVVHSMDYAAMDNQTAAEFVKRKKVIVVGLQKSALDIAVECSTANGLNHPCTVLYRTKHWNVPDHLPWGIPLTLLYLNRFSELLVHKPNEGFLLGLLATILSPLRWGISKFVESYIKSKLQLAKFDMVPKHSFLTEINSCLISSVPKEFYSRVEEGSIRLKKAQSFGFSKKGVLINDEVEPLSTDLVILATGFNGIDKLKDIFVSTRFQTSIGGTPENAVPLYRECVHPRIPQLAIIGFSESISNLYTSELRCQWLVELMNGSFKLPSIQEMEKDIAKWDEYMKEYSGKYYRRSCIGTLHIWYNDQLCKDMGKNPKRKKGVLNELFEPYVPRDYAHL